MARIAISGLTKRFAATPRPALDALDLEVVDGELLVLVGPSGCGKSTALRMIAGLEEPSGGSIHIGDRDVTNVAPQDRDVAMVFQGYALYPHLNVHDNMAFPLKMRGQNKATRTAKVREIAALVGLSEKLERLPSELSGGERQRVAMGRAIVRQPKVFLFDEPLSNLDAKLRAELRVELVALIKRLGSTAVYVTHDQAEAMTMGDRVAVLNDGRLQQVATPREVYETPSNTFVATFVGSPAMNMLSCDEHAEALADSSVPGGAERCGFRPEHVALATSAGKLRLSGEVTANERLGAESLIYLRVASDLVTMRVPGFAEHEVGDSLDVVVSEARLHWFAADGTRLVSV